MTFFDRATQDLIAESAVHEAGLDVIEPSWFSAGRISGLIARDNDVMVAVLALTGRPGDDPLSVARAGICGRRAVRDLATTWMSEHNFRCGLTRVDVLCIIPHSANSAFVTYLEEVL